MIYPIIIVGILSFVTDYALQKHIYPSLHVSKNNQTVVNETIPFVEYVIEPLEGNYSNITIHVEIW